MEGEAVSALKIAFDTANTWDERSTIIVVVGLAIEFIALLLFSKDMPKGEKILLVIGSIAVAVGCGGEYIFSARAATAATGLQQASDERIAQLSREQQADHKAAAEAIAMAADLGVKVDALPSFVAKKEGDISDQIDAFKTFATDEKQHVDKAIADLSEKRGELTKARNDAVTAANNAKADIARAEEALAEEEEIRDQIIAMNAPRTIAPATSPLN